MKIAEIMKKMIDFSGGNIHDIDHLIRVWTYARTIGELEGLDAETQYILEVAAITHDIACPLCREKYGNTNGKHQETEGARMVRDFLRDTGLTEEQTDRVAFLVGHHHTFADTFTAATIRSCGRRTILPTPQKMAMSAATWRTLSIRSCGRRAARPLPKRFSASESQTIKR